MNKRELDMLEKAYDKEISGGMLQTVSQIAVKLKNEGYLDYIDVLEPPTRQCPFQVRFKGYVLTHLGRSTYCSSDRCK